jgi:hypothetical protein
MSGTVKIALAVVVVLFLFGGVAIIGLNSQNSAANGSTGANTAPNLNVTQDKDVAATITYTGKGFEPNLNNVPVHSTLRIRNRSVRVLQFMSNPYGKNSDEPELNVGQLNPGDSKTFYISQKGIWGYHNALDPSETGQITTR